MTTEIKVEGVKEIQARLTQYPGKFGEVLHETLQTSMTVLDESKPEYPPKPTGSTYVRTGTLGRTLGSGNSYNGIRTVKPGQGRLMSAEWGSRLKYAPYVIGEKEQAWMHKGRWWTVATVASRAKPKIEALFRQMTEVLAKWLDQ